jgi:LysR family glycine cleavage system transcriptional activator
VASRDIASGRLVVPFGPEIPVPGRSYHLVCGKGDEKRAPIKAFRDWVFAEIAETHAALGVAADAVTGPGHGRRLAVRAKH